MKKIFLLALCLLTFGLKASADEGMWLLQYLQQMNYADMKTSGLKLKATDVYNPDGLSLKDAIVQFGNGCTGEIVSSEGLLFTNHHCGYGNIQQLSSLENDYLANGFWAMNRAEEIPVPGLSVKFVRKIVDVTPELTAGITDQTAYAASQNIINARIKDITKKWETENPGKKIILKSFYGGNQYFLFVIEEYKDIRFVGAPPSSIGKFGGDTDNWMWPRHTGDFSIFRVYAAADGTTPAAYSTENVPYKAPVHLTVSAKGYKDGDYAMIMGFPGTTTRYMTSYELDELLDIANPNRILIRGERQEILMDAMTASDKVRIQYSDKYANSSNYWKNSIGKSKAVRKLGIRNQRVELEKKFTEWASADPARAKYLRALPLIAESKKITAPVESDLQVLNETILTTVEMATIAAIAANDLKEMKESAPDAIASFANDLYKDYDEQTERRVTKRMVELMMQLLSKDNMPSFVQTDIAGRFGGNVEGYVNWLYDTSVFANKDKFLTYAASYNPEVAPAADDPALALYKSVAEKYLALASGVADAYNMAAEGHKLFIAGLQEMEPDAKRYPDANLTIRLTYGNVKPYSPADGVFYNYYTTLSGIMEKEDPRNPVDFTVPQRLKELYLAADYGRFADYTGISKKDIKRGATGHINTCFITTNDITGGNSGSPVLNDKGELIGLAFDGNWDAMSGDILFEQNLQRCINLDVRYLLFVIDKYAGAGHLIDEMTIAW